MSSIPVACDVKRPGSRAEGRTRFRRVLGKRRNQMRSGVRGGDVPEERRSGAAERCGARTGCGRRRANSVWRQPMRTAVKTSVASKPAAVASMATWNSVSLARPGVRSQESKASSTGASRAAKSSSSRARRKKDSTMGRFYRRVARAGWRLCFPTLSAIKLPKGWGTGVSCGIEFSRRRFVGAM